MACPASIVHRCLAQGGTRETRNSGVFYLSSGLIPSAQMLSDVRGSHLHYFLKKNLSALSLLLHLKNTSPCSLRQLRIKTENRLSASAQEAPERLGNPLGDMEGVAI